MEKLVHLFWGIITKPQKTFKDIKETRPTREGLIILISSLLLSYILFLFVLKGLPDQDTYWSNPAKYMVLLSFLLGSIFILIAASILNYLAKAAKLESSYLSVLNIFLFASVPYIITFPISLLFVLFLVSKIVVLKHIIGWATWLWYIILIVIGNSVVLSISIKRSLGLCLRVFLMLFLLIILVGIISGIIGSKIGKSAKHDITPFKSTVDNKPITESQKQEALESEPAIKIDEEKLKATIMSLALSSNISIDTITRKGGSLEVKGVVENLQLLSDFVRLLEDNQIKADIYSFQKIQEDKILFTLNCSSATPKLKE